MAAKIAWVSQNVSAVSPSIRDLDYPFTDFIGRCFLRMCLLEDLITSWTRRRREVLPEFPEDLRFKPLAKSPAITVEKKAG
jgi:hypothetical protein